MHSPAGPPGCSNLCCWGSCCQSWGCWSRRRPGSRSWAAPPAPWSRCSPVCTGSQSAERCFCLPSPAKKMQHYQSISDDEILVLEGFRKGNQTWNLSLSCSERLYHQTLHCLLNSSISLWISSSGYCLLCWAQQAWTNTPYAVFFCALASVIVKFLDLKHGWMKICGWWR